MKRFVIAAVACTALSAGSVWAEADIEAGKAKSATCAACHGPDLKTPIMPTYPKLAGQNAAYSEQAMLHYKKGERGTYPNAMIMQGQMAPLSEEDIKNIAAYMESLEP